MIEACQFNCPNCGGDLIKETEERLRCRYCSSDFENNAFQRKIRTLQEFLDKTKLETINNQRRNLYDAVCAKYISKNEVHHYATEIKQLLPDDFQANFYLEALSGDVKKINNLIREINVEENYEILPPIIHFLIASLENEFLLELNLLVERAYKKRDLNLYSYYSTKISEEATKVSAGVYETFMPRDVFIAYSSKDMETVSKLCEELEDQGFSCFVAARNLRHGVGSVENYDDALKEAMDYCTCFLFVSTINSRKFDCDAVRKEIPYIRSIDTHNAPAEFRHNYKMMPAKYKKPRIEYRIGSMVRSATNAITNEFFDGYEWVYDIDGVIDRLVRILTATPEDVFVDEPVSVGYNPAYVPATPAIPTAPYAPTIAAPMSAPIPMPMPTTPVPQTPKVCNHVEVIDPAVEATCTTPGRTEGSHCSLCGEILRQSIPIPARGHEFGMWHETKKASCTEDGEQERSCHCGEKETKIIPSPGKHQPGEWEIVKEPTEKEFGLKIKKCTICGEHTEEEKLPLLPPVVTIPVQPTPAPTPTPVQSVPTVDTRTKSTPVTPTQKQNPPAQKQNSPANSNPKQNSAKNAKQKQNSTKNEKQKQNPTTSNQKQNPSAVDKQKHIVPSFLDSVVPEQKPSVPTISQNLAYKVNADGRTCSITGQGTCKDKDIVIPEKIDGYRVTGIITETKNSNDWFISGFDKNIKSVVIPNSVISIGDYAFHDCETLFNVTIPNSVISIGENAFSWCKNLTSLTIPYSVKTIGADAFSDCSRLSTVILPASVISIENYAFANCTNLLSITIPNSVVSIGDYAFSDCTNLSKVTLPDSLTSIGNFAFCWCQHLESVAIPNSVTNIGEGVFHDCENLATVTLPDFITTIGNGMFCNCKKLENITLPNSVKSIGNYAFSACTNLMNIHYKGTKAQWKKLQFIGEWKTHSSIRKITCNDGDIKFFF